MHWRKCYVFFCCVCTHLCLTLSLQDQTPARYVSRQVKSNTKLHGQRRRQGMDYQHSCSPVPHTSGFRTGPCLLLSLLKTCTLSYDDISQAFFQDDLLKEKDFEGDVYISLPPGYGENAKYVDCPSTLSHGACTQQSGMVKNCVRVYGKQRLQDSWLRKIYVVH